MFEFDYLPPPPDTGDPEEDFRLAVVMCVIRIAVLFAFCLICSFVELIINLI